jgi:hypothetical protein
MGSGDTRRLLKVFGVAVTDFEDEATVLGEPAPGCSGEDDALRVGVDVHLIGASVSRQR